MAAILGETSGGLTNAEITSVMNAIKLRDPLADAGAVAVTANPLVAQGQAWVRMTKRERIGNAIGNHQARRQNGKALVSFITEAMRPTRYASNSERFQRYQSALNQVLVLEGLKVNEGGRVARAAKASTLSDSGAASRDSHDGTASPRSSQSRPGVLHRGDPRQRFIPRCP